MIKFPLVFIYFVQVSLVVVLVLYFESFVLFASFEYQFVNKMKVSLNRLYCLLKISDANFLLLLNIDLFSQHWQNQLMNVFFLFFCFRLVAALFFCQISNISLSSGGGCWFVNKYVYLATNDFVNR